MASAKFMISVKAAVVAFGCFVAAPAVAAPAARQCNPPRPNLEYPAWYRECEGVLQARFRDSNPYQLPYTEFVRMIWQMYEVRYFPGRHPGLVGSQCSPEGSGYMNQSGHAQLCRNGRWTVKGQ